jgi:uncharacterized damage-inducible protein DinB
MKRHLALLAAYNAWCNQRLYDAAALLPDADYRADRGAFFRSLHGTLNHLVATDRIWMRRFTGKGDAPSRVDAILFETLHDLRHAREAEDQRIRTYIDALSEADLSGLIRYRTITNPTEIEQSLDSALLHFFNHQTHHRGQAHCLLTGFGLDAPSFDLIMFQRESRMGMG